MTSSIVRTLAPTRLAWALVALFPVPGGLAAQRPNRGSQAEVWKYLAEKYDADADGRITRSEYPRGTDKFRGYDQDGDNVLTARDFAGAGRRRMPGRGAAGRPPGADTGVAFADSLARALAAQADGDRDGVVTHKEWDAALRSLDRNQDAVLAGAELLQLVRASLGRPKVSERAATRRIRHLDSDGDGTVQLAELGNRFARLDGNRDRLLSRAEWVAPTARRAGPPRVGELAPDFDLPLVKKRKETVRLSSFRGKKPVALIFGSYT